MLFDRAKIFVKAGDGGAGSASFRREKYIAFGGPDGGDGGWGGNVVLAVSPHLNTLLPFKYKQHFKAQNGTAGAKRKKHGKAGDDLRIEVPPGTVIWDGESDTLLGDLVEEGQELIVARGGRGGLGNTHFATSTHQTPRIAEIGEPGEERWIRLELRLIADVGLVGFPNAGKSTLLGATSAAKPKIAPYPFTTISPNLGVVEVDNYSFVAADIPGLIEGAHRGVGLGLEFLRHIERTRLLVHVLDGVEIDPEEPLSAFDQVNREMAEYNPALADRPQIVAVNKIDVPEAAEKLSIVQSALGDRGYESFGISAATGQGVQQLMRRVKECLLELPKAEPFQPVETVPIIDLSKADEDAFAVHQNTEGEFVVEGTRVERLAAMTNLNQPEAVRRLERVMDRMGINRRLEEMGVQPGDTIVIGKTEIMWAEPQRPISRRRRRRQEREAEEEA